MLGFFIYAVITYKPARSDRYVSRDESNAHVVVTNTIVHSKLASIGQLATYEYSYEGYTTYEADKDWVILNSLTRSSVEVDYEGVIKAGVSVGDIDIKVDEDERIIYLTMPQPTIISNEITIPNSNENVAIFGSLDGDTASSLMDNTKNEELNHAIANGLYYRANDNAKQIIRDLLAVYDDYDLVFIDYDEGRR